MKALLKAHPDAVTEKDEHGDLPLHLAIANKGSDAVVLALLAPRTETAKTKGWRENLLLHYAAANQASEAVLKALLEAHRDGVKEKDEDGKLPLHLADQNQASEAVVLALLEADMPLRLDDGALVDHGGSWPFCVASTNDRLIAAVCHVLASQDDEPPGGGFGVHIHALDAVREEQGRTALEASTKRPRKAIYDHLLFCGSYELHIGAPEHRSATSVVLRATNRGEKTGEHGGEVVIKLMQEEE